MVLAVTTDELRDLVARIGSADPLTDAAEGIERIALLEALRHAAAADVAKQAVAFDAARRADEQAAGVPAGRLGQGVAGELALARRESSFRARRHLGFARILLSELPRTLRALESGQTSEWRAMLLAQQTAGLSREHRARVDATIGPRLGGLGDRAVTAETRRLAAHLDPAGIAGRLRRVEADRTVTLRPAPDAMSYLTAHLPVAHGVAVLAALRTAADTTTATGDQRGRGQIMADTLVERATGQSDAAAVPVTINLIMTDQALLCAGPDPDQPATVDGYGPIPAPIARDLATGDVRAPRWIRQLYAHPDTGQLVAMHTRTRCFTPTQRQFVRLRDLTCRTPYCGAPIRHTDHIQPVADGGPTALSNAQGLCEACNHTKQAPGWASRTDPDGSVIVTTPSGHSYRSPPVSHLPCSRAPTARAMPP